MWAGPRDQNNFSFQSSATGLANAEPGTALLCTRKYPLPLISPLRSRPAFSHTTKATFCRCLFINQVFWGVYFFPSFVLVRFLWALRKLECFFILKFVREMKADIRCACPSNGQKSENHKRKSYCSLFVVCCEYIRLGKNKLGRGTLFPVFFRRKRRGRLYYTGYSPFLQDFLNFDTGIKNSTAAKLFFNIFVIWQIEQSGIIAIKTN